MTIQEKEDIRLERNLKEIWAKAQEILSRKIPVPKYQSWVIPTQLVELSESNCVLAVSNEWGKQMLGHWLSDIHDALASVLGRKVACSIFVDTSLEHELYTPSLAAISSPPREPSQHFESPDSALGYRGSSPADPRSRTPSPGAGARSSSSGLNEKYTFDTFVIGSHNRFSHSAAKAVAERPGKAYSPLFIYGGVGLGKTHIMQAIGHEVLRHSPSANVRYMSCERFTNELINSIRDDRMIEFRKRYRQVDVLLMDDIQFIEGKESTQEEFFHTFNALREREGQIVLSSDRPPKALSHLEERLRSRFEWGLIADIQAPDYETRLAILHKKRQLEKMSVGDDVLEYIASVFTTNIRELEGALIRAHAYGSMTGAPLTVSSLASVLQPMGKIRNKPVLTIERILDVVSAHYRVETSELKSAKRSQDLALPRHVAMYLAHDLLQISFPRIGDVFGNRAHTTVLYAYNRIKEQLGQDGDLSRAISQIKHELGD